MHIPGQKRIVVIDRFGEWDLFQNVPDPCVWLHAVEHCGLNQGVKHRAGVSAGLGVGEQPPLSSNDKRADRVFTFVVVCALLRHV